MLLSVPEPNNPKQFRRGQGMAPGQAVKVLLATCPRALLRSTLTAWPFAKNASARKLLWRKCFLSKLSDSPNNRKQIIENKKRDGALTLERPHRSASGLPALLN